MKRIFGSVAVIIMASTSFSQTQFTSIEEILKRDTTISLQENQKQFNMDGPVYSEITNGKYLSIITASIRAVLNGDRTIMVCDPKSIYWLGADTLITNIPNKSPYEIAIAFLQNPDRIITLSSSKDEGSLNFYTTDGKLFNSLTDFGWITSSPSGKYFIQTTSVESEYPLYVFDEKGEIVFHISTTIDMVYQAAWFSDSILIVGSGNMLSLWDVINQKKLWEIIMPSGSRGINEEFAIISSQSAGIILIYDSEAGCYSFSTDGNLIWQKSGAGGLSRIDGIGICDVNGLTAIASADPAAINIDLLTNDGRIIAQARKNCPSGARYYAGWKNIMDVSSDYSIFRYVSLRGNSSNPTGSHLFISVVLSNQKKEPNIDYIDGLWFLFQDSGYTQAFIGVDNANPNLVKSYLFK